MALTTPAQFQALATELNTDPRAYGYAPMIAVGSDDGLAGIINTVRGGTNGAAIKIKRSDISPGEVLEAIDVRDFPAAPQGVASMPLAQSWLESITQLPRIRLTNDDGTKSVSRKNLDRLVADTQGSQARLDAVALRNGSRAEELFGAGVVITGSDVGKALRP